MTSKISSIFYNTFWRFFIAIAIVTISANLVGLGVTMWAGERVMHDMQEETGYTVLRNVVNLIHSQQKDLEEFQRQRIEDRKESLKYALQIVGSLLQGYQKDVENGRWTLEQAKAAAGRLLSHCGYGDDDYFFGLDKNYRIIFHPDKSLWGRSLYDLQDPDGLYFLRELFKAAKTAPDGSVGYTRYRWPRKGDTAPEPKISASYYFRPWEWVFGSGVYIADIDQDIQSKKAALTRELQKRLAEIKLGRTGYVFVFDADFNMIAHPSLENMNIAHLKNPETGVPILAELKAIAEKPWGRNVHRYLWDRPGDEGHYVHEKLSWCTREPLSGLYVAASAYVDEIEAPVSRLFRLMLVISVLTLLLTGVALYFLVRSLLAPVKQLIRVTAQVGSGNMDVRVPGNYNGEIGVLCAGFNRMIDSLEALHQAETRQREALTAAEAKYRSIFKNAVEGIFQSTPDGRFLSVNPAMADIFGYDSPQAMIEQVSDIRNQLYAEPSQRDEFLAQTVTDNMIRYEALFLRKDKTRIWCRVSSRAIFDEQGNLIYSEGILEDITENRKVEQALRESEARYRLLLDSLEDAVVAYDPEGRVSYVNPAFGAIYGWGRDEWIGRRIDFVPEHEKKRTQEAIKRILDGAKVIFETQRVTKSGSLIDVQIRTMLLRDENGQIKGVYAIHRDITAQKRSEEALRQSEAKYQDILENMEEGYYEVDLEGNLLFFNPAMARILGYSESELEGKNYTDFVDPAISKDVYKTYLTVYDTHETTNAFDWQLIRKDGNRRWIEASISLHKDKKGRSIGFRGICRDVTERRRAQIELKKAHDELEIRVRQRTAELEEANQHLLELDRLKSGFLSSVSHELRTPLTSILGFAKLVAKDFRKIATAGIEENSPISRKHERVLRNLDVIIKEGERLTRLINDVLDLSKIESGQVQWKDEVLDIKTMMAESAEISSGMFTQKPEVTLVLDIPPNLPTVRADPDKLMQVLINLQNNAAKFTSRGEVRVSACVTEDGAIRVDVADTGCGIPQANLEKVFDKFHQVMSSDTLKDKPGGTGLGLAICKQIIAHYGGRIWVKSQVGQGSTFSFSLPTWKGQA